MKIGGLQKTSVLDYPDKLSAIIWTIGCNFRCPFCYNKHLVFNEVKKIEDNYILEFLKKRKDKLEAISISGGEPLIYDDIFNFIKKVKKLGYLIKIDTNGAFPIKLKKLIDKKLVDYISMDIKAPKHKYCQLCGVDIDISKIEESIKKIKNDAPDYEFKTTIVPGMLIKDDIINIAKWLKGSKRYYLQQIKSDTPMISSELEGIKPYSNEYLDEILKEIKPFFKKCSLRGIK
jgi:pyruvate formate lyase activating enzyme